MILCVNPNAAIDKTVIVSPFHLNKIHRPQAVKALPGGKGCNVARALKRLGDTPVVTGWVGGSAGQFIEHGLHDEGIQTAFVHTDFESRTCLSILDAENNTMTEIYENGEAVPPEKVEELKAHFRAIVSDYAAVTLSGSLPQGVPQDFYADLITMAHEAHVPVILDSSREALKHGVEAQPFLIKPNNDEVAVLVGKDLNGMADYAAAARDISQRYHTIVVLSLGPDGALAVNDQDAVHVKNPPVEAQSAVGSGDSMLAGLAYGFTHKFAFENAIAYGVAAGTANTLQVGAGMFSLEDFERVRIGVTVTRV